MGKNSYLMTQRYGLTSFWRNSWSNKFNFNNLFIFFYTSNKIIENILINIFKFNIINKKQNSVFKKKFNLKIFKFKNLINLLYIGRIWFLKFSKWVILNINILFKNKTSRIRKKNINLIFIFYFKKRNNINYIF
jgi:hypothetical protein